MNKYLTARANRVFFFAVHAERQINSAKRGFTLTEMLVVIAVITILAAMSIPALTSVDQARGVTEAGFQLRSAIELARSHAVSRRTHVWLGMEPVVNDKHLDLRIGMVISKDGSANSAPENLRALSRSVLIERVGLSAAAEADVGMDLTGAADLATHAGGEKFKVGRAEFKSGKTLTFTPLGEVFVSPNDGPFFDSRVVMCLRQSRKTTLLPGNDVAIVIDGSAGIPTIYRK